jgi:L-amino acid N-acyltransferase YncA
MGLNIRVAQDSDADQMLAIYAPIVRETAISFELQPPGAEELRGRVRNILSSHVWLVCEEAGTLAGYAYASNFRSREAYQWTAEVTVYVAEDRQRRGIGNALYRSLFEAMRLQGFCSAVAGIALPNDASVKLHKRFGFQPIGVFERAGYKLGRWHDVGWWRLELQKHVSDPNPPRRLWELAGSAEWQRALEAGREPIH